ncbi:hypothetical protein QTO34_000554 [Cnephaeus nilssonii]|uniref:Nucleophosmin n=1 Tax=Cnephaeus nilssonii TaxID=3371016 RepID=A0AA40LX00_CNENI|nr:hypothetical protein QTO34_000554 [Eptesicus nilssonii]
MNYEGSPIKVTLSTLRMFVQPTVSLGDFEIIPPVVLGLKCGKKVKLSAAEDDEDNNDDDDFEDEEAEEKAPLKKSEPKPPPDQVPDKGFESAAAGSG